MSAKVLYSPQVQLSSAFWQSFFATKFVAGERVYVKIHFGEPGNKTAFSVADVRPFVEALNQLGHEVVLWDCPVAYASKRDSKAGYEQVIKEKGFTKLTTCEICDDYQEVELPAGQVIQIAKLASKAKNMLVLTHAKGHVMAGFGGSVKNIGIGAVSPATKGYVHGLPEIGDGKWQFIVERLGEVVAHAWELMPKNSVCVNILQNITQHCDCMSNAGKIVAPNLGTLISDDPVSVDVASLDLIAKNTKEENLFLHVTGVDPWAHVRATVKASGLALDYELESFDHE